MNFNCKDTNKINDLVQHIKKIYSLVEPYTQDKSFAYYYPKGEFFMRRCTYVPFKDYAIRYHLVNVLSTVVENSFIKTNFAHRTQRSKSGFIHLFPQYHPIYKKFIKRAEDYKNKNTDFYLLKADITSFYDSVSHEHLINSIFSLVSNILPQKYKPLLHQILRAEVESYSVIYNSLQSEEKHQGLLIGNNTEGYLANILLHRLDELMISQKFNYARYVDDIQVITNTEKEAINALNIIQEELHRIGLALNSAKTDIKHNPSKKDLLRNNGQLSFSEFFNEDYDNYEFNQQTNEDNINIPIEETVNINLSLLSKRDKNNLQIDDISSIYFGQNNQVKHYIRSIWRSHDHRKCQEIVLKIAQKITNFLFNVERNDDYDENLIISLIEKIPEILELCPKTIKSNVWSIVKFINFGFSHKIMWSSYKAMNYIFKNQDIIDYARTRLIHQLVKSRKKDPPYLIMMTKNDNDFSEKLVSIFQTFLSKKSIDLSLNALYAIWILSHKENRKIFDENLFRRNIDDYLPRPISQNISRVLSLILEQKNSLNFFDDFDFTEFSQNDEKI